MNKYVFREYRRKYILLFEKEKNKLEKFLPKRTKIEHIGSTAVPSLGGKGIIDIIVGFKDKNQMKRYACIMKRERYEMMPGFKKFERISFKKVYGFLFFKRRVHIHFVLLNGKIWKRNIQFRNNLIKSSRLTNEYARLKKQAVKIAGGEGKIYRAYKDKFIEKYSS